MKACPVCRVEMIETVKYDVEIDVCPKCGGVWLDRGELEKIVRRVKEEVQELVAIPAYKDYFKKKKKKKPIFFEIFGGIMGGILGSEALEEFELDFDFD